MSRVVVFDEDAPLLLIGALQPEVYVKGGHYALAELREAALLARWAGRTAIVPRTDGRSSSGLVERIRAP